MATQPVQLDPSEVELQEEGQQAAQTAPAPLQNATRDLGVTYRSKSADALTSDVAPTSGQHMVAAVEQNDPRNIDITDQKAMDEHGNEIVPHELYHTWVNNLAPSDKARIPQSNNADYTEPTVDSVNAMRAQGKKLLDVPGEQAAQMMAWAGKNKNDPAVQKAVKPYLDDMRNTPESTIEGTAPSDKTINTHPRAPMGPRDDIPGMEELSGQPPRPDAKAGPYRTNLSPQDEQKFQQWVKQNHVPNDDSPHSDYDMRGYWKERQDKDPNVQYATRTVTSAFDGKQHYPDTFKTPYHKTFSNESVYATEDAPKWQGNKLVSKDGKVVADETPKHFVQRGAGAKLSEQDAQKYMDAAKGNKDIARSMAKHDGHTF